MINHMMGKQARRTPILLYTSLWFYVSVCVRSGRLGLRNDLNLL